MNDYQLIVIGAGPGGYIAALHAARMGKKTAVMECREIGGACVNRGCIPTKSLLHASWIFHEITHGQTAGITAGQTDFDLSAVFERKSVVSRKISQSIEDLFRNADIDVYSGQAQVTEPGTVRLTETDGTVSYYTTDHIIVATGAMPVMPAVPGADLPRVINSDQILDGSGENYRSVTIVGGGIIGVEFATFYNDLDCQVTILEQNHKILPAMDRELGQNLEMILRKRGVSIYVDATIQSFQEEKGKMVVNFTNQRDIPQQVASDVILCATGRRPNLKGVFAPELAPEMDGYSLKVNESYETSIPKVYAIGDVSSKIKLAHAASAQGTACVDRIFGAENTIDTQVIPKCIYTRPEIASVGMTEEEAKAAGIRVKVGKTLLFGNARSIILEADRSFMKVLGDADTGRIIGAQLMCEHATDMISQLAQAIANGDSPSHLLRAVRPHPTIEEALTDALENLDRRMKESD